MIKYYIVPAEGDGLTIETSFRPKYMSDLKINWSGIHLVDQNVFLITINTKKDSKVTNLNKLEDVVDVSTNSKAVKTEVESKFNIDSIGNKDVFETLCQLKEPDFTKDKLSVSSD